MKKNEIARQFVESHKKNDPAEWQPMIKFGNEKLLIVYENLESGVYGEVSAPYDDETRRVEIGKFDSATGNPIEFEWDSE
jgi:hypothetical protein